MRRPAPLPEGLGTHFTVRDALGAGVSYDRLRNSDLTTPFRGVRLDARLQDDLVARCAALSLRLPPGTVFSHNTAAMLSGIPVPLRLQRSAPVHVSVPPPRRAVDIAGVTGHRLEHVEDDTRIRFGLRVSPPWRVTAHLAAMLSLAELVAAMDVVSNWEEAPPELNWWTRRGRVNLRRAMSLVDAGAESPAESALRVTLVELGLPRPTVNPDVLDARGAFVARPDMLFEGRAIVEYEGDHHRTDREQWHRDISRTGALQDLGYRVLRATAADLRDPFDLAQRLRRSLAEKWVTQGTIRPRSPQLTG